MYRFLITGANGFVGQQLCQLLKANGRSFLAVSRSAPTSEKPWLHQLDALTSSADWSPYLSEVNAIIHLAARVHVLNGIEADPLASFRAVNVSATVNLARQAAKAGVRRFVYVSTIKVNGEVTVDKAFRESGLPAPADPYSISKWEAEQALHDISRQTGMEIVIVRPPLVYGPGVKANFYRLMRLVDKGWPLPLAMVSNRRSMIHVGNLADALVACAERPAAAGKTYLVSDGEDVATPELIRRLAGIMGRQCRLVRVPVGLLRILAGAAGKRAQIERLTQSLEIDSTRIRSELDWQPPCTLQQGLDETVRWYLESREREA